MGEPGEHRSSLLNSLNPEAKPLDGSEQGSGNGGLGTQSTAFENHWLQGSQATSGLGLEDPEEEIPPEEVIGVEIPEASTVEAGLNPGVEAEVVEMRGLLKGNKAPKILEWDGVPSKSPDTSRWTKGRPDIKLSRSKLSISEKTPSVSTAKGRRRKGRRLMELARPKTNWQCLKGRMGCCCKGYAWITPRKSNLQFCLYWPSVYWTERFIKDTTLTITVPEVTSRVEELSRPKRFYLEHYNKNRTTPVWPIPRSTLEYQASNRLKELATPKVRNNIWSINMSEVSQVSRAAQMAVATPRILQLSKPRPQATLLEEWDPMPKPKPYVSDYKRLLRLATPKALSEKCVPDRSPCWEILDATKKAVATSRTISLAQPKIRKDLNEGYDPYYISPASLVARASPRLYELATPKYIVKKV